MGYIRTKQSGLGLAPLAVVEAAPVVVDLLGKILNFGGKLVYGVKAESFPKRWTDLGIFRNQWFSGWERDGRGTFWWDRNEQGGAGVDERLGNTTARGMTMADAYIDAARSGGASLSQALGFIHEIYLDTASNRPPGYTGRGAWAASQRDGTLKKYWSAYMNQYGPRASRLAGLAPSGVTTSGGSMPGVVSSSSGAPVSTASASGGLGTLGLAVLGLGAVLFFSGGK